MGVSADAKFADIKNDILPMAYYSHRQMPIGGAAFAVASTLAAFSSRAELLIATRGGMAVRFKEDDVRPMGRFVGGVGARILRVLSQRRAGRKARHRRPRR